VYEFKSNQIKSNFVVHLLHGIDTQGFGRFRRPYLNIYLPYEVKLSVVSRAVVRKLIFAPMKSSPATLDLSRVKSAQVPIHHRFFS